MKNSSGEIGDHLRLDSRKHRSSSDHLRPDSKTTGICTNSDPYLNQALQPLLYKTPYQIPQVGTLYKGTDVPLPGKAIKVFLSTLPKILSQGSVQHEVQSTTSSQYQHIKAVENVTESETECLKDIPYLSP